MARSNRSSGASSVSALRRDFADQNIARLHFRADANHAVRSEVVQRFFAQIRNVTRDFFRPELGVARADLELVDVNGSVDVFLHHLLRDQDGVLKVVAVPRHERDQHVATERQFAVISVRSVGNDLTVLHMLTLLHDRLLVDAGGRIRPHELAQFVNVNACFRIGLQFLAPFRHLAVFGDDNLISRDRRDLAAVCRNQDGARVARDLLFQARADKRRFGDQQRHGLALHVRTHERAVGVVVFQERNQARRHRHQLLRRHIHVMHFGRLDFQEVAAATHRDFFAGEMTLVIDRRVRLRDEITFLAVAGQIFYLIGHATVVHLAIRRFNEAKIVDPRKGRHRAIKPMFGPSGVSIGQMRP